MASNSRGHACRRRKFKEVINEGSGIPEIDNQQIISASRGPDQRKRVHVTQHDTTESIAASLASQIQSINYCIPTQPTNPTPTCKQRRKSRKRVIPGESAAVTGQQVPGAARLLTPPTYCEHCGAKKFQHEPPSFCCSNGQVKLASNPFPAELDNLFTGKDPNSDNYRRFSRLYNNFFAFSSIGGKTDIKKYKGLYIFKLHGQIYHFLPNLVPTAGNPKYLQLYFYDSLYEHATRSDVFKELKAEIISTIMKVMDRNPYAQFFRQLSQLPIDEETTIHINKNAALDQRVYNAPTANEVAAIWPDQDATDTSTTPHIIVHGKGDTTHRIKHYYGCYDPLQYPLLFPHGESGWHPGIPRVNPKNAVARAASTSVPRCPTPVTGVDNIENFLAAQENEAAHKPQKNERDVSCREYYAYLLQIRKGNRILASGRVLLQFIVDMYVKIENTRLDFLRNNQSTIRADLYQGIVDTILLGEVQGANAGHRIVLPPSFIGGPRDLKRRYLNAMQLVQRFGKPDIFATMTCNPNWPEIKAELGAGEVAQHRPDLLARIFHAKLIEAKKEIMEKKVFGEVSAFIYVIEFQKRGLPHAHFLIVLAPSFKLKCPEEYDRFVSAQIPPTSMPHLRGIVLNHMMHGPCGNANPKCPCMKEKNGKSSCKSHFPKAFAPSTTNNDH